MDSAVISSEGFNTIPKQVMLSEEQIAWLKAKGMREKKKRSTIIRELINKAMLEDPQAISSFQTS